MGNATFCLIDPVCMGDMDTKTNTKVKVNRYYKAVSEIETPQKESFIENSKLQRERTRSRENSPIDSNTLKWHMLGAERLNRKTSNLDLGMDTDSNLIYSDSKLNASFKREPVMQDLISISI